MTEHRLHNHWQSKRLLNIDIAAGYITIDRATGYTTVRAAGYISIDLAGQQAT